MRLVWIVLILVFVSTVGIPESFAEKIVSIQKTIDVDKLSIIDSISHLERYSQILPDYIQSSKLTKTDVGNMKIGLDWISIDTDIKFIKFNDRVTLEVISGDFKGTILDVILIEKPLFPNETLLTANLSLQRSWHMEILTSFVSDTNIESMLHTSLNGLVGHTKNPPSYENLIKEKEPFCIFGLCF